MKLWKSSDKTQKNRGDSGTKNSNKEKKNTQKKKTRSIPCRPKTLKLSKKITHIFLVLQFPTLKKDKDIILFSIKKTL
jgi:hypothetical protein